jgi:hypothetical protein
MTGYRYQGDRLTDPKYKGQCCEAVRRADGKCIRGRNGNMLVRFGDTLVVVLARQLRKVQP